MALGHPLYMNGQLVEGPANFSHVPGIAGTPDGLGGGGIGLGATGTMVRSLPRGAGSQMLNAMARPLVGTFRAVRGLGDPAAEPEISPAALALGAALGFAIRGVAGYVVGRAVAPSRSDETKYAMWGIVACVFGGSIGLGIEAAIALNSKD